MTTVIDLTSDETHHPLSRPQDQVGSDATDEALIDLTGAVQSTNPIVNADSVVSKPNETRAWRLPDLQDDHMQAVVDLLVTRPVSRDIQASPKAAEERTARKSDHSIDRRRRKSHNSHTDAANGPRTPTATFKAPRTIHISDGVPISNPVADAPSPLTARLKRSQQTFRFLHLPPELRNRIYSLLLTTFEPIDLTESRQTIQKRTDRFAKCKTAKARRSIKTIFLEILQTSKQIHQEATTILYGTNLFKIRSDHKAGFRDPKNLLPEKYLGLLKRVKVSVISREADNGQEQWVADLLNNTFSREKTRLEVFELTWFGWKRFCLTQDSVLCQALLNLNVEKDFAVKLRGDVRMRTAMLKELKSNVKARKVEIQRPVVDVLKDGRMVEVSDVEEQE